MQIMQPILIARFLSGCIYGDRGDVGMSLKRSMDKSDSNRTFALDPSFELMRHEVFFAPNARPVNSKFRPAVYCPETMPTPSPAA
jgi:hypothetical protein